MTHTWKPGQLEAIQWREGELIVSASAGTGKTAVIIERAWQLVADRSANVDDLLIVTFTDDAANQLKTRFRERLDREMLEARKADTRAYLRDQLHRLDRAQISTIHSLCLRIIRENFFRINIGGDISILPPEQAQLLKHQIVDELFEDGYVGAGTFSDHFRALVARYGGTRFDENLRSIILKIHAFLASLAHPEQWIKQVRDLAEFYRAEDLKITGLPVWNYLKIDWLDRLDAGALMLRNLQNQITGLGNAKLVAYLADLIEVVECRRALLGDDRLEQLADADEPLPRSPQVRKTASEHDKWQSIKNQVDKVKDQLKDFSAQMNAFFAEDQVEMLAEQALFLDSLMDQIVHFHHRLSASKQSADQLEFDDLQRLALEVLAEDEPADAYRRQFKYLLVDEYQDINEIQDTIIRLLGRRDKKFPHRIANLFMVGDVKQSIYRFRLAEPEIFQNLYHLAGAETHAGLSRIDLPDNFRSRCQVIDAVNAVFTALLRGGEVELEYNRKNQLACSADYPESSDDLVPEIHILERDIDSDQEEGAPAEFAEMKTIEREAYLVARRVKELLDGNFKVAENNALRPVEPEDIAILLRSMKNVVGVYIAMLRRMGINVFCQQIEAFLAFPEIADIVSLLKIIHNPYQDIPLATVLRSPLVEADLSELTKIRLADRGHLYTGLINFVADNPDDPSAEKFTRFIEQLNAWRQLSGACRVAELVQQIFLETDYPEFVRAGTPGRHGHENLNQFLELAWRFSADGRSDLPHFLEYLDMVEEQSTSLFGVQGGTGKGVRLQTIHASKGLEYPVVILGNIGKKTNLADIKGDLLIDRHLLVGLRHIDPDTLVKKHTLPSQAISRLIRNKSIAEELRLFYVAMTRAKEKLILVGSASGKDRAKIIDQIDPGHPLLPGQVVSWESPLAWITAALASIGFRPSDSAPFKVTWYDAEAQSQWAVESQFFGKVHPKIADQLHAILENQKLPQSTKLSAGDAKQIDALIDAMTWEYPWKNLADMPASISVTELINLAKGTDRFETLGKSIEQAGQFTLLDERADAGREKGKALHRFLEKVDLRQQTDIDSLRAQLHRMVEQKLLTSLQAQWVDLEKIEHFFDTRPGRLMLSHPDRIERELSFTYSLPADQFPPSVQLGQSAEPILIQGIVDCLVRTDEGLVIIDYKTNNIGPDQVDRMTEHYRIQLEMYARALSDILRQRVVSAWIYFTEPNAAAQVL